MSRIKFNPEISISHLILAVTFLLSAMAWKSNIEADITKEAHARELADTELAGSMERISTILSRLEPTVEKNRVHRLTDEAHWTE